MENFKLTEIFLSICNKSVYSEIRDKIEIFFDEQFFKIEMPIDEKEKANFLYQCKSIPINVELANKNLIDFIVSYENFENNGDKFIILYKIEKVEKYNKIRKALEFNMLKYLNQYITDELLNKILTEKNDPLNTLIIEGAYNSYVRCTRIQHNFVNQLHQLNIIIERILKKKDKVLLDWFDKKIRLYLKTQEKNTEQKNAIIGEIFAIGYFINMFLEEVIPIQEKQEKQTPDFYCKIGNETVYLEVNTPSMNTDEKNKLKEFEEETDQMVKNAPKGSVISNIIEISPVGYNEKFKTTNEMCISKFSNIKSSSKQLLKGNMNILVINLFNKDFWTVGGHACQPLYTSFRGEGLETGYLWQAFYAKKGDSVLESYNGIRAIPKLMFDGMFNRKDMKRISATLIMIPNKTILFENHNASTPLSYEVLMQLIKIHHFDSYLSQIRIPKSHYKKSFLRGNSFKCEINKIRKKINSVNKSDVFKMC